MIDFNDLLNFKPIEKEIFVDSDLPNSFLVYIIDHKLRTIVTYAPNYVDETIRLLHSKIKLFDIDSIGLYYKDGVMSYIYKEFYNITYTRNDIYRWRMQLHPSIRNRTHPIYYYEVRGYKFVLEDEYIKELNEKENKMDIKNNRADEIFKTNIGHLIKAEVLTDEKELKTKIFEGKLINIFCNTFIVAKEKDEYIEMFRYEDLRQLQVVK